MIARSLFLKAGLAVAFLLSLVSTSANAAQSIVTGASIEISEPGAVRVVRDAPLVILVSSGLMAQFGATFTISPSSGGVSSPGFVSAATGSANMLSAGGAGVITGTTVYGEALSISIDGGNADATVIPEGTSGLTVRLVIAQYN